MLNIFKRRPKLKVVRLDPLAQIPKYATKGAACFDLHACLPEGTSQVHVMPGKPVIIGIGLAFEVPPGKSLDVYSRSGHGFKADIRLANCVGILDSDYRDELMVKLTADGDRCLTINNGDRIAQARLVDATQYDIVEVDTLSETDRTGGLGSTGV